jgi:predicted TIM-barrel fold metal-dependent hydrolase|tara:strand:- start:166 stop:1014 length:849 start_codon:yes stop_codon:yes gene_type:complete
MRLIDAQVHAYERNHKERPWFDELVGPEEVTADTMVGEMERVGVDGAILVSPWTMYRYDASYAISVYEKYPNKFRLVKPVDPNKPEVGEIIQEWAKNKGAVAIRLMLAYEEQRDLSEHGLDVVMRTASRCNFPVNLLCWENVEEAGRLAKQYPNTRLVIDHLGIKQPFKPPVPDNPFSKLQKVLELASHDNVVIKITGVCTLSHQAFPFSDIWDPLQEVFSRFSLERCMWGTDWTRAVKFVSYRESVDCFLDSAPLSLSEKAQLMGKTLDNIYGWSAHPSQL